MSPDVTRKEETTFTPSRIQISLMVREAIFPPSGIRGFTTIYGTVEELFILGAILHVDSQVEVTPRQIFIFLPVI